MRNTTKIINFVFCRAYPCITYFKEIPIIMNQRRFISRIVAVGVALCALAAPAAIDACTSMIVSAKATVSGRPMLWKHRDTSAKNNYLYRVEPDSAIGREYGFVGLFNGADSLALDEAWMGMNDVGFAIMNTVAYNLQPNSPSWIDREGIVMAIALGKCRTVDDFAALLDTLPKPLGVMTNFGVIDAAGNGAYFETDDSTYTRYNLCDAPNGVMIRTNYAYSGTPDKGMGYIRHENVEKLLAHEIATGNLTPALLTEGVSRSFFNARLGYNAMDAGDSWTVDQDFVPRHSSTSTIVVEGLLEGESAADMIMWANLGYPPCSHVVPVTLSDIPAEAGPTSYEGFYSPMGLEASRLMERVFPVKRGNGPKYINLNVLRAISEEQYGISLANYSSGAAVRNKK